jgi:PAS domain-containing protein
MSHPIEIILTRQLAEYLSVPLLLVDSEGDLLFYNEPAESILGRRFEDTGRMPAKEWSRMVTAVDDEGQPIAPDDLPLMVTLSTRMPAHRRLHLVDGEHRVARDRGDVDPARRPARRLSRRRGDVLGAA